MSKKFGQVSYSIPDNIENLLVSIDGNEPQVLADHENVIEPMVNFRLGDMLIKLDPSKRLDLSDV